MSRTAWIVIGLCLVAFTLQVLQQRSDQAELAKQADIVLQKSHAGCLRNNARGDASKSIATVLSPFLIQVENSPKALQATRDQARAAVEAFTLILANPLLANPDCDVLYPIPQP